jgi:GTPase Era involved in 16S rRNA processing
MITNYKIPIPVTTMTHKEDAMPVEPTPQDPANTRAWIQTAQSLARRAGCDRAVSGFLNSLESADPEKLTTVIAGLPNSGKSNLVNDLVGRKLLPVSPTQSHFAFEIEAAAAGVPEQFFIANAARPLEQLSDALRAAGQAAIPVRITLDSPWLASSKLRLAERGPLDEEGGDMATQIRNSLRDADISVLAIEALAPLRKLEAEFLRACSLRSVVPLVVLTKLDSLAQEEHEGVIEYVRTRLNELCPEAKLLEKSSSLKSALEKEIPQRDFVALRDSRRQASLLEVLETIASTAKAGTEAQLRNQREREAKFTELRNNIDAQNLLWMRIEQQLKVRRESVEEQIRTHLEANQDKTLAALNYDLQRTNDVKAWWERDLPFRLQSELRAQAAGIESAIDRQLTVDRKWLQEELHRQFQYPLVIEPNMAFDLEMKEVVPREVKMADAQKLRTISRVGTAGIVLVAGALLGGAGIGGAMMATSVLAGIAAETWNNKQTQDNREKISIELRTLIGRAGINFAADVSEKIRNWYDEVVTSVRTHQEEWQQAKLAALQAERLAHSTSGSNADWKSITEDITSLVKQIRSAGFAA